MNATLPSGLPKTVRDDEGLVRFITSSSQFVKTRLVVKAAAFLPNKEGETSVFRQGKKPEAVLWDLADKHIIGRKVYGVAIFTAKHVRNAALDVLAKEPPPRHANIVNWPTDSDKTMEKARRKAAALTISQEAELILR